MINARNRFVMNKETLAACLAIGVGALVLGVEPARADDGARPEGICARVGASDPPSGQSHAALDVDGMLRIWVCRFLRSSGAGVLPLGKEGGALRPLRPTER